jgi:alpha-L-arabinofuranosidase
MLAASESSNKYEQFVEIMDIYGKLDHKTNDCSHSQLKKLVCHNCKASDHNTKSCSQPKKKLCSKCRICGSTDHRGNKCLNKNLNKKNKICSLCKEVGHVRNKCQKIASSVVLKNSFKTKLLLDKIWNAKDALVLVSPSCLLSEFKTRLVNQLIIDNIISIDDVDVYNRTIYIDLNQNKDSEIDDSKMKNLYDELDGMVIHIGNLTVLANKHSIMLELKKGYNMNLVLKKDIGIHVDDVYKIIDRILSELNAEEHERKITDPTYMAKIEAEKIAQQMKINAEQQALKIKSDAEQLFLDAQVNAILEDDKARKAILAAQNAYKEKLKLEEEILAKNIEKKNDQGNLCCVCIDEIKNILILPCRHVCICSNCITELMKKQKTCPMCRTFIDRYEKIFV